MKRLLSLLVTGSLLVTPVLAAQTGVEDSFPAVREPASFADVASGSWYTDAAGLCYVTERYQLHRHPQSADPELEAAVLLPA